MTTNIKKKLFSMVVGVALVGTVAAVGVISNLPKASQNTALSISSSIISDVTSQEVSSMIDTSTAVDGVQSALTSSTPSQANSTISATAKVVSSFEGISEPGTYTIGNGVIMTVNSTQTISPPATQSN